MLAGTQLFVHILALAISGAQPAANPPAAKASTENIAAPYVDAFALAAASESTTTALPQMEVFGPTGGKQLIGFAGSLSKLSGDADVTSLDGQITVGYFLTDVHEVGGELDASISSGDTDSTQVTVAPYYNYNIRSTPRQWFYVGGAVGLAIVKSGGDTFTGYAIGPHCGMRYWITPRSAFFVEPSITFLKVSDFSFTDVAILFGLTITL